MVIADLIRMPTSSRRLSGASTHRLVNELSVLLVIAMSLAVILYSGARLGRELGWKVALPNLQQVASRAVPSVARVSAAGGNPATAGSATTAAGVADDGLAAQGGGLPPQTGVLRSGTWIPVLMYHYVRVAAPGDRVGYNLSVTPQDFEKQMRYLRDHGYSTVLMRDVDMALLEHKPLPSRPVALTFDDGYRDFYTTAAPIMRDLGLTATAYIATDLLGRSNYMNWSMVKELDSQGFEMAGHTEFHVDLVRQPPGRAKLEIEGCKAQLEQQLGHPVVDFAYPYGTFDFEIMQLVRDAGFWSSTTTANGGWHDSSHLFDMSRVRVAGGESLEAFARGLVAGPPSNPSRTPEPSS